MKGAQIWGRQPVGRKPKRHTLIHRGLAWQYHHPQVNGPKMCTSSLACVTTGSHVTGRQRRWCCSIWVFFSIFVFFLLQCEKKKKKKKKCKLNVRWKHHFSSSGNGKPSQKKGLRSWNVEAGEQNWLKAGVSQCSVSAVQQPMTHSYTAFKYWRLEGVFVVSHFKKGHFKQCQVQRKKEHILKCNNIDEQRHERYWEIHVGSID